MSDLEPKEPGDKCNARKTDGSGYCEHTAGWGTDHTGHGRCKFHGGSTPDQEKHIMNELEDSVEHGAVAIRLFLKHAQQQLERGELSEVDAKELDRLFRTAADRSGWGPSSKREIDAAIDGDLTIDFDDVDT